MMSWRRLMPYFGLSMDGKSLDRSCKLYLLLLHVNFSGVDSIATVPNPLSTIARCLLLSLSGFLTVPCCFCSCYTEEASAESYAFLTL